MDKKNRNAISGNDIRQVFDEYLDMHISDEDINEFVKEMDLDSDGLISYTELIEGMGYQ